MTLRHLFFALLLIFMAFSGCLSKPCEKTTDCGPNEICKDSYCAVPTCRQQNETCDVASDCCQGMTCENSHCRLLQCPDCDDDNLCTSDFCNVTSEQCGHTFVLSCCGNEQCEAGENCGTCADCACSPGFVCTGNTCVEETANLINSIKTNHSLEICRQNVLNKWSLGRYGEVKTLSENCSAAFSGAIAEIRSIGPDNQTRAELLLLDSELEELYFMHYMAETIEKKETQSKSAYDNFQYLSDMKSALFHLETAMYDLYLIKMDYPASWGSSHEALFDGYAGKYEEMNQRINALYDDIGNYDYKYAFQVDPNDPLVIDISDEVTPGRNQQEIRLALLQYVYSHVEYVPDPNWQTDWVQPPAYTLMTGQGDCDDSSVLLASLFLRAGVEDTLLCSVDSDYDGIGDHLTVGVGQDSGPTMIYESVWPPSDYLYYEENETPPTAPQPVSTYNYPAYILYCAEPSVVMGYALADKCSEGTPFGECSSYGQWYCDNGTLVPDCVRCGCPSDTPNCATGGEDEGYCFVCERITAIWIPEYGVCCPRGYPEYDPDEEKCYKH